MMTNSTTSNDRLAAVEGVSRRTVHVRTPDGITLAGTLRVPQDSPLPAPAVLVSPPGPVAVSDQSVVAGYAAG
jgi:dipeptidyl aminopeptidase/acylaminoacyl peptidase